MLLLYNKIDSFGSKIQILEDLGFNHHDGEVPKYASTSMVATHYSMRIEFYSWLFEVLFYLNKTHEIIGTPFKVYTTSGAKLQGFDFDFLCNKESKLEWALTDYDIEITTSNDDSYKGPELINFDDFMEFLYDSVLEAFDSYETLTDYTEKYSYDSKMSKVKKVIEDMKSMRKEID